MRIRWAARWSTESSLLSATHVALRVAAYSELITNRKFAVVIVTSSTQQGHPNASNMTCHTLSNMYCYCIEKPINSAYIGIARNRLFGNNLEKSELVGWNFRKTLKTFNAVCQKWAKCDEKAVLVDFSWQAFGTSHSEAWNVNITMNMCVRQYFSKNSSKFFFL